MKQTGRSWVRAAAKAWIQKKGASAYWEAPVDCFFIGQAAVEEEEQQLPEFLFFVQAF